MSYYLVKNQGIKKLKEKVSELDLYGRVNGYSCGATFLVFTDYSIVEEAECTELSFSSLKLKLTLLYLKLKMMYWLNKLDPNYQEPF